MLKKWKDLRDKAAEGDPRYAAAVAEELLIVEAHELIVKLLEREGVTRTELARRLGVSQAFVSHVLSGERNMTLRTLASFAHALGYRITLDAAVAKA